MLNLEKDAVQWDWDDDGRASDDEEDKDSQAEANAKAQQVRPGREGGTHTGVSFLKGLTCLCAGCACQEPSDDDDEDDDRDEPLTNFGKVSLMRRHSPTHVTVPSVSSRTSSTC